MTITGRSQVIHVSDSGAGSGFLGAKAPASGTMVDPTSGDPEAVPLGVPSFDVGGFLNPDPATIDGVSFGAEETWIVPVAGWHRVDFDGSLTFTAEATPPPAFGALHALWSTSEGQTSQLVVADFRLEGTGLIDADFGISAPIGISECVYLIEGEVVGMLIKGSAVTDTTAASASGTFGIQFLAATPAP